MNESSLAACRTLAPSIAAALTIATWFLPSPAGAHEVIPPIADPREPNAAGIGIGTTSDYLGSDDYFYGAAPMIRFQREGTRQSIGLYGNTVITNVVDHPWLRTGPTALYRFGRNDVQDDVVDRLADIDDSLELGWTIGAEWIDPENIARRARIDTYVTADVSGGHDGTIVGLSASGWLPIPNVVLLGLYGGISWADGNYTDTYFSIDANGAAVSGLDAFEADAGARDARFAVYGIWPITESWAVGAGVFYQRLLGDAADSPITKDRGSPNQWLGGVGIGYAW